LAVVPAHDSAAVDTVVNAAGDEFVVEPRHWDRAGAISTVHAGNVSGVL
jgi:hypothetical protein